MSWIPEQWERRKSWKDLNAAGSNPLVRESERERERERVCFGGFADNSEIRSGGKFRSSYVIFFLVYIRLLKKNGKSITCHQLNYNRIKLHEIPN